MGNKFKNISPYSVVRDVLMNFWVVILVAAITYMSSYIYVFYFNTPSYSSSMTLAVSNKSSSAFLSSRLSKAKETANVFQTIFQSDILKTKIEEITGKPLEGTVSASVISETNLIVLTGKANTPMAAFNTVSSVYKNYRYITDYSFEDTVMYVLRSATVPFSPDNSISFSGTVKRTVPVISAFALALIVFLSVMRDTVKTEAAVKEYLLLDVFATVYHERKNKTLKSFLKRRIKRVFINDPLTNKIYIEAFKKIAVKLEFLRDKSNKKVFVIASTNENEGKTTIAVNTAITLTQNGNRVLLIDLDLRKPSVWRFFPSIDYSEGKQQISDIIKNSSLRSVDISLDKDSGLFVLGGKKSVAHSSEYLSKDRLPHLVEKLASQFDFIIIDTSPYALISDSEIIAKVSDGVILVVKQDNSTVDALNDTISSLSRSAPVIGCIFNDVKTLPGFLTGENGPGFSDTYGKYYR